MVKKKESKSKRRKKEGRTMTAFNLTANQNLRYYAVSMGGSLERGMSDVIVREESAQAAIDYLSTGRAWSQLKRNGWEFRDYTKFVDSGKLRAKELGTTLSDSQTEDNQILE